VTFARVVQFRWLPVPTSHPMPTLTRAPRELRLDADAKMLAWARGIARGVCQDVLKNTGDPRFRKGDAAEKELEGVALLRLATSLQRYDESRLPPDGNIVDAFKGYTDQWIRTDCRRAAVRIRNGGVVNGRVRVVPLPVSADGGDEVADPDSEGGEWCDLPVPVRVMLAHIALALPRPCGTAAPGDTRAAWRKMRRKLRRKKK